VNELSWPWIGLMVLVPLPIAVAVAVPVWRRHEMILGNLAGTAVIFGTAFALILIESVRLDQLRQRCFDQGFVVCWPTPSAFARYAIYASIGLVEVVTLFLASLKVEGRARDRRYAPEWRSK
jgi:hypothetical protein